MSLQGKVHKWQKEKFRESLMGYLFISPWLAILGIFIFFSIGFAFYLSFHRYDLLTPARPIGLENYLDLIKDPDVHIAFLNTAYYTVVVVSLQTVLALILATLLNKRLKGRLFFRAAFYVPSVTASVVISLIFMWMYYRQGIINFILSLFHLPSNTDWLGNPLTALPAIMTMNIWSTGPTFMIIFLAALQDVPETLHEAARLDGATSWECFRHITLPLLRPSIFLVVVMGTIGCLQVFDQIYIMTAGGPLKSTMTLVYLIFTNAFRDFSMGYACALAFIVFFVIFFLTLVQKKYIDVKIEY